MQQALEDIKAAWDNTNGLRDAALARSLSDALVLASPELFAEISTKSLDQLCSDIEVFRNADMQEQVWLIEAWLLHRFEPQNIGGVYQPQVRIAEGE